MADSDYNGALLHFIKWYSQPLQFCVFGEDAIIQIPNSIVLQRPVNYKASNYKQHSITGVVHLRKENSVIFYLTKNVVQNNNFSTPIHYLKPYDIFVNRPICKSLITENPSLHFDLSKLIPDSDSWTTFILWAWLNLQYSVCIEKKEKPGHLKYLLWCSRRKKSIRPQNYLQSIISTNIPHAEQSKHN